MTQCLLAWLKLSHFYVPEADFTVGRRLTEIIGWSHSPVMPGRSRVTLHGPRRRLALWLAPYETKSPQPRNRHQSFVRSRRGDAGHAGANGRWNSRLCNGHAANAITKAEWEQAKRDLKSESGIDPKEAMLEAAPESERWDPVPGSAGHQALETPPEGENEEGSSETQLLAAEGVEEAARDQTLQAARAANKEDREKP